MQNSYNWANLFDKILRLIKVEYESVIAEMVDNSMDNNAENVLIRFSGKRWDDFSAVILDDGVGFRTPEKLFNSFDLAIQDVAENTVGEEKRTGINDIGMKLTPLSYCDSITVITRFDNGTIGSRTLSRESAIREDTYQTEDSRQEFREFEPCWKLIEDRKWRTAVIIHNHHKQPFSGSPSNPRKYCQNLAKFLGITYNEIIDDADINLSKISIQHMDEALNWDSHTIKVVSLDPFWTRFTPKSIKRRIEQNVSDKFARNDSDLMEALIEFGTVCSEKILVPIKSTTDNKTYNVKVQAFVLPPRAARTKIPKIYSSHCFDVGIAKSGTSILQKVSTSGFYFYRNKRCISFGTSGYAPNKGFYHILTSPSNQQLDLRIKVEFPKQLDDYFNLEPTKNGVSPPDEFFDDVVSELKDPIHDDLLRGNLTSSGNKNPFFDSTENFKDQSRSLSSKCVAQKFLTTSHLKSLVDCRFCGYYHHKDTKCKNAPKESAEKTAKLEKRPKPKPKTIQGNQTILPSQIPVESQMQPGADTWTLILKRNNPEEIRDKILKVVDEFGISLE